MVDYTPEGLRTFGKLVWKLKEDNNWSYLDTAKSLGFGSPSTISAWVKNVDNPVTEPSLKNLNTLAPHVMNPISGVGFTGEELLQVCQGKLQITDEQINGCSFRVDSQGIPVEQRAVLPPNENGSPALRTPLDSIQATQLGSHYVEMANQYWFSKIEPAIDLMLEKVGDRQADGSIKFASKEYDYAKHPPGIIEVLPKDGRPVLTPETMNNRDWQILRHLAQTIQAKYGRLQDQQLAPAQKEAAQQRPQPLKV